MRAVAAAVVALGVVALALDERRCSLRGPCGEAAPAFADARAAARPSDVRVLDRNGAIVHELRADRRYRRLEWTPLAAVAPALVRAVVASEDRRFREHRGVDARALVAGALQWLGGGPPRGGSTITMQLAALLDGASGSPAAAARRRGLREKWRQVRGALAIERAWTKDQILEAYLNLAGFRGELVGVGAAAHLVFAKAPHALGEAEAIALAALLRAPNAPRADVERRATDLAARLDSPAGRSELATAVARATDPALPARPRIALAPHAAARLLGRHTPGNAGAPIRSTLGSTLDASVQRFAVEALDRSLRALAGRNASDGAALAVDNRSGEILAWVGSSGALSSARHVDGVVAHRQAGSTLKPFLYALALDRRRLTAASLLEDLPLALPVAGGVYRPRNYDEGYRGIVTLRSALAGSLNVPAVRTLGLVGVDEMARLLREAGFAALDRPGDHYGPALALGAAEVSLAELVNAYRAIANGGVVSPLAIAAAPAGGRVAAPGGRRVISPEAAFVVADVLSDRESRAATFGLESPLAPRFWAAVKTGTSKDMRDNWCVGFSSRYTVGVWVGNASGEPMHDVSGISGAAPAWLEILGFLHRDAPAERPSPPPGLARRRVAFAASGEPPRDEWFLRGTEPPGDARGERVQPIRLAAPRPRIAAPVAGSAFAVDPDIPPANQRIPFAVEGDGEGLRWRLDGRDAGAAGLRLWRPEAGRHRLALVDGAGAAVDEVAFDVRPASAPPAGPPSSRRPPRSPGR